MLNCFENTSNTLRLSVRLIEALYEMKHFKGTADFQENKKDIMEVVNA